MDGTNERCLTGGGGSGGGSIADGDAVRKERRKKNVSSKCYYERKTEINNRYY